MRLLFLLFCVLTIIVVVVATTTTTVNVTTTSDEYESTLVPSLRQRMLYLGIVLPVLFYTLFSFIFDTANSIGLLLQPANRLESSRLGSSKAIRALRLIRATQGSGNLILHPSLSLFYLASLSAFCWASDPSKDIGALSNHLFSVGKDGLLVRHTFNGNPVLWYFSFHHDGFAKLPSRSRWHGVSAYFT
ncbi:unnamed protein product [Protopolystoma xenopodis]|uniref:G-protein coupled receptors family 1 profile domain-containing protein n=1 Tax=Protopolystoma xenopodis TaxID=117903 RepID=A0A3S5BC18_9PLAT|nr:unnamed protein product [Protopolystoma xenopodis]